MFLETCFCNVATKQVVAMLPERDTEVVDALFDLVPRMQIVPKDLFGNIATKQGVATLPKHVTGKDWQSCIVLVPRVPIAPRCVFGNIATQCSGNVAKICNRKKWQS